MPTSRPFGTAIHMTLPEHFFHCTQVSASLISCSLVPGALSFLLLFKLTLLLFVANIQPSTSKPITSYTESKTPTEQRQTWLLQFRAQAVLMRKFQGPSFRQEQVSVQHKNVLLDESTSK